MKNVLLSLAIFILSVSFTQAQDYHNSVGLRAGFSTGISFKHFFSATDAAEGILASRFGGFSVTGLFERHQIAFKTKGLNFYYGAGAHIGFYDSHPWERWKSSVTLIGIDGILGLEYVFVQIPFNIGLDWKPSFNLAGYTNFLVDELALSFRFVF